MRKSISLFSMAIASVLTASAAVAAEPAAAIAAEPAAAPAVPAAVEAPKVDRMQQTVCRKDKVIGSLVSTKKTCHTRAQWAYIDDTNQQFSRDLVDQTRTKPGGN